MSMKYQDIPTAYAVTDDPSSSSPSKGYGTVGNDNDKDDADGEWHKGEIQPPAYRDAAFGIIFGMQFFTLVVLGILYAAGVIEVESPLDEDAARRLSGRYLTSHHTETTTTSKEQEVVEPLNVNDLFPLLWATLASICIAPALTVLVFSYMHQHAAWLIKASIWVAVGMNVVLAILCLVAGVYLATIGPALGAFFTCLYAKYVWHRIPYAAANLKTAIAAIRSQLGVAFLGLASIPVYICYWVLWIYVFAMTLSTPFMQAQTTTQSTQIVDDDDMMTLNKSYSGVWWTIVIFFLLSFFWTNQVVGNTVQATVSGTVGTWWFVPEEARGCCSPALTSSLFRSLTYSFGSICFGSLLVAIIQTLKAIVQNARQNRDQNGDCNGILLCLAECLLRLLEQAAEYFNKWAFIYVGIYGYSYIDAGKNVLTLFRQRGWTAVISDDLTARVLGMMSFAIGIATATIAGLIAAISSIGSTGGATGLVVASVVIALILGMILASNIFQVVNSGVDTIIVLFAEAPKEFQGIHPELAMEMNEAWAKAWPDMFSPSAPTMVV